MSSPMIELPENPLEIPVIISIICDSLSEKDLVYTRGISKLWHQLTFPRLKKAVSPLTLKSSPLKGILHDEEKDDDQLQNIKYAAKAEDYVKILERRHTALPLLFDENFILLCEGSTEPFDQFITMHCQNVKILKLDTEKYDWRQNLEHFASWLTLGKLSNLETLELSSLSYFPRVNGMKQSTHKWPHLTKLTVGYIGRENPSKISNLIPELIKRCPNLETVVLKMDNYDIDQLTSESERSDGMSDEKISCKSYYLQDRANYTLNRLLKSLKNASKSLKHLTLSSAADVHFETLLDMTKGNNGMKLESFGFRSFGIRTTHKFSKRIVQGVKPGSLKKFLQSQSKCLLTFKIGTEPTYHGVDNLGVLEFPFTLTVLRHLELEDADVLRIQENLQFSQQFPVLESLIVRGSSENEDKWLYSENNMADPCKTLRKLTLSPEFVSSGNQGRNLFSVFPHLATLECEFPTDEFLKELWRPGTGLTSLTLHIHGLSQQVIGCPPDQFENEVGELSWVDNIKGLKHLFIKLSMPADLTVPTDGSPHTPQFYKLLLNKVRGSTFSKISPIQGADLEFLTQNGIRKYLKDVLPEMEFGMEFIKGLKI